MKTKTITKEQALANFLECEKDDIKEERNGGYFSVGAKEYLVLTDEEAEERVTDYIKDSLWAFKASFILGECGLPLSGEESLETMQKKSCEGANDFILALVENTCGLEQFIEDAISADGRGHFLSSYDGEENEQNGYYIYRTN